MKTLPYEKASVRSKRIWREAADKLGTHPAILKHVYIENYCVGIDCMDFIRLVTKPTDGEDTKFIAGVKENIVKAMPDWPLARCEEKERKDQEFQEEHTDFTDLIDYRLKQLIQVGDEIVSNEDKTFCFSGKKYQSAGKRYRITSLDDRRENLTGFHAVTTSDIRGTTISWCVHGIRSVWRKKKEIFNWWQAYHDLWVEQNPDHPQTSEMEAQRDKEAAKAARGEKD